MVLGLTFYRYGEDYGTDPRGFLGWNNDTKLCMFMVLGPASLVILICNIFCRFLCNKMGYKIIIPDLYTTIFLFFRYPYCCVLSSCLTCQLQKLEKLGLLTNWKLKVKV